MVPPLGPPPTPLVLCLQSLSWTCTATTRPDPDLWIDFPAWPWTCHIAMDLLAWWSCTLGWAWPWPLGLPYSLAVGLGSAQPSHVLPLCCWRLPSLTASRQPINYFLQFFLCFHCLHRERRKSARGCKRKDGALIKSKTQDSTLSIKITWI